MDNNPKSWEELVAQAKAEAEVLFPAVSRDSEEARQNYEAVIALRARLMLALQNGTPIDPEAVESFIQLKRQQADHARKWRAHKAEFAKERIRSFSQDLSERFPQGLESLKGHARERGNLHAMLDEYDTLAARWVTDEACLWEDSDAYLISSAILRQADEIC